MTGTQYSRGKNPNSRNGFKKGSSGFRGYHTKEAKKKMRKARLGKKETKITRIKKSEAMKGKNSKGGITPENERIRQSIEMRLWREAVFARDNWTCQKY